MKGFVSQGSQQKVMEAVPLYSNDRKHGVIPYTLRTNFVACRFDRPLILDPHNVDLSISDYCVLECSRIIYYPEVLKYWDT